MKITERRIWGSVMLLSCVVTIYQALHKPQPIAPPQNIETIRSNVASFDRKVEQLETPHQPDKPPAEVHFSSDEVRAELAQSMGVVAASTAGATKPGGAMPLPSTPQLSADSKLAPDSVVASGDVDVKDYSLSFEGDVARGQFITNIGGKTVYVTLAGHLGSQGGYVTFDPTEFKVGDLSIPISLVNPELQKKLAEQRGQMKLPDGVQSLHVENGELVATQK
jgi:hypothetical protein